MFGNFCKKIANFVMMGQKNMVTQIITFYQHAKDELKII
jgi:hypothetical protein